MPQYASKKAATRTPSLSLPLRPLKKASRLLANRTQEDGRWLGRVKLKLERPLLPEQEQQRMLAESNQSPTVNEPIPSTPAITDSAPQTLTPEDKKLEQGIEQLLAGKEFRLGDEQHRLYFAPYEGRLELMMASWPKPFIVYIDKLEKKKKKSTEEETIINKYRECDKNSNNSYNNKFIKDVQGFLTYTTHMFRTKESNIVDRPDDINFNYVVPETSKIDHLGWETLTTVGNNKVSGTKGIEVKTLTARGKSGTIAGAEASTGDAHGAYVLWAKIGQKDRKVVFDSEKKKYVKSLSYSYSQFTQEDIDSFNQSIGKTKHIKLADRNQTEKPPLNPTEFNILKKTLSKDMIDKFTEEDEPRRYVRGHLLNHWLHGSGDNWENLAIISDKTNQRTSMQEEESRSNISQTTIVPNNSSPMPGVTQPITSSSNNQELPEEWAKNRVLGENKVLSYKVEVSYDNKTSSNYQGFYECMLPTKLTYDFKVKKLKPDQDARQESSWEDSTDKYHEEILCDIPTNPDEMTPIEYGAHGLLTKLISPSQQVPSQSSASPQNSSSIEIIPSSFSSEPSRSDQSLSLPSQSNQFTSFSTPTSQSSQQIDYGNFISLIIKAIKILRLHTEILKQGQRNKYRYKEVDNSQLTQNNYDNFMKNIFFFMNKTMSTQDAYFAVQGVDITSLKNTFKHIIGIIYYRENPVYKKSFELPNSKLQQGGIDNIYTTAKSIVDAGLKLKSTEATPEEIKQCKQVLLNYYDAPAEGNNNSNMTMNSNNNFTQPGSSFSNSNMPMNSNDNFTQPGSSFSNSNMFMNSNNNFTQPGSFFSNSNMPMNSNNNFTQSSSSPFNLNQSDQNHSSLSSSLFNHEDEIFFSNQNISNENEKEKKPEKHKINNEDQNNENKRKKLNEKEKKKEKEKGEGEGEEDDT